jgi:hypothetical protein
MGAAAFRPVNSGDQKNLGFSAGSIRQFGTSAIRQLFLIAMMSLLAFSQTTPQSEQVTYGNYVVKQSFDFGYRYASVDGSTPMYNTMVDLHRGPRLLDQTLELRSRNHSGLFFDSLSYSGFGYGGDPSTAARVRIDKGRLYTFTGNYRRSLNYWDFDLLANPLNPPKSNPSVPIASSPHRFDMARHMNDSRLTLLPQSRAPLRFAYSRNTMDGPATTTAHVGNRIGPDLLLFLPWTTKQETYNAGIDFKFLPRTTVSYDQFFERLRDGSTSLDRSFAWQLPNGTPYDTGTVYDTSNSQPCSRLFQNPNTQPPTVFPFCSGATAFSKSMRYHATYPTEQLSFESNAVRDVDLSGRFSYSTAQMRLPAYASLFSGFVPFSQQQQISDSGTGRARRTSATADFGATWAAGERLQFSDTLRFARFHIPGNGGFSETSLFASSASAVPNAFSGCKPPFTAASCPAHTGNSPADVIAQSFASLLAQDHFTNQLEGRYELGKHFGARLGWRYEQRNIDNNLASTLAETFYPTAPTRGDCAGRPIQPDGSCQVTVSANGVGETLIHQNSLLAGAWAMPVDRVRLNFDLEWGTADRTFTRIDPRRFDQLRGRASYRPAQWLELAASANRGDSSNPVTNVDYAQHHRAYSLAATASHAQTFALELAYDYSSDRSHALICYVTTQATAVSPTCPGLDGYLQATSFYDQSVHFGNLAVKWRPVRRVTAVVGYNVTNGAGSALLLNPLAPPGPTGFVYHRPTASLAIDVTHRVSWRAAWGYYGYDDRGPAGPTLPRDFTAQTGTVSLRYAF